MFAFKIREYLAQYSSNNPLPIDAVKTQAMLNALQSTNGSNPLNLKLIPCGIAFYHAGTVFQQSYKITDLFI